MLNGRRFFGTLKELIEDDNQYNQTSFYIDCYVNTYDFFDYLKPPRKNITPLKLCKGAAD